MKTLIIATAVVALCAGLILDTLVGAQAATDTAAVMPSALDAPFVFAAKA